MVPHLGLSSSASQCLNGPSSCYQDRARPDIFACVNLTLNISFSIQGWHLHVDRNWQGLIEVSRNNGLTVAEKSHSFVEVCLVARDKFRQTLIQS